MKVISITLTGIAALSQSKAIASERATGESHDAFEQRVWPERMHTDGKGRVIIPPQAIKSCLEEVAGYLGDRVPGKGQRTYKKLYLAGLMVTAPFVTDKTSADVQGERLFVPSDGVKGGGKRVWKTFPFIAEGWTATGHIHVLDPTLETSLETVRRHLEHAGTFIGIGRFRPINGGHYGRFTVTDWTEGAP